MSDPGIDARLLPNLMTVVDQLPNRPDWVKRVASGEDIYRLIAAESMGKPYDETTVLERARVKDMTYMFSYGSGRGPNPFEQFRNLVHRERSDV